MKRGAPVPGVTIPARPGSDEIAPILGVGISKLGGCGDNEVAVGPAVGAKGGASTHSPLVAILSPACNCLAH